MTSSHAVTLPNGKDETVSGTGAFTWNNVRKTAKTAKSCCVINCTKRSGKNPGRSFHRRLRDGDLLHGKIFTVLNTCSTYFTRILIANAQ